MIFSSFGIQEPLLDGWVSSRDAQIFVLFCFSCFFLRQCWGIQDGLMLWGAGWWKAPIWGLGQLPCAEGSLSAFNPADYLAPTPEACGGYTSWSCSQRTGNFPLQNLLNVTSCLCEAWLCISFGFQLEQSGCSYGDRFNLPLPRWPSVQIQADLS